MRFWQLPTQCRLVVLKMLKDEQMRHGFVELAENLKLDEFVEHLLFGSPLSFDPPPWLKSPDVFSLCHDLRTLNDEQIVVHVHGVLALRSLQK
jgi:hypothetical protein